MSDGLGLDCLGITPGTAHAEQRGGREVQTLAIPQLEGYKLVQAVAAYHTAGLASSGTRRT